MVSAASKITASRPKKISGPLWIVWKVWRSASVTPFSFSSSYFIWCALSSLYLYSTSILYYRHLPLTGHPYLPEITEISILSSLTAKYLSARFHLLYSDRLSHGSLPSRPLTPLDSPPYYYAYASLSYDPIRLISVAVDASPYYAPSGAFCRSWHVSLV